MSWLLTLPYAIGYWWGYKRTIDKQITDSLSDERIAAALEAWSDLLPPPKPPEQPQEPPQEPHQEPESDPTDPEAGQ